MKYFFFLADLLICELGDPREPLGLQFKHTLTGSHQID